MAVQDGMVIMYQHMILKTKRFEFAISQVTCLALTSLEGCGDADGRGQAKEVCVKQIREHI
jgi:hypothetical protein